MNPATAYNADVVAQRNFITKVYGWMSFGLILTAIVAEMMYMNAATIGSVLHGGSIRGVILVLVLAQFGVVIGLRWCLNYINALVATLLFCLYAGITGIFFSAYLFLYTPASLASSLAVTAGTFGIMSFYGFFTKRDLTSIGSFCMMALVGLILGSIVNFFMQSTGMYWFLTYAAILIFVALTAYDTQKMKYMYMAGADGSEAHQKAAIIAAFTLYLDFVILFQNIVRILGRRR
jgi:FtsH-binding integral membrane protein